MKPKTRFNLSILERRALKTLYYLWKLEKTPLRTVHTAYGLMRRAYYTKRPLGIEQWFKICEKLVEKGLLKRHEYDETIYVLTLQGEEIAENLPEEYYME